MLIHTVKPGETLWQIANYYRTSVTAIAEINELPDPNQIVVGLALVIPTEDIFHTVRWRIIMENRREIRNTVQAILRNNQYPIPII